MVSPASPFVYPPLHVTALEEHFDVTNSLKCTQGTGEDLESRQIERYDNSLESSFFSDKKKGFCSLLFEPSFFFFFFFFFLSFFFFFTSFSSLP